MLNHYIQRLTTEDAASLQHISVDTFTATYANFNTEADMQLYVITHFNLPQLTKELADRNNYFFGLIIEEALTGYVKLRTTENPEELQGRKHIEIERIYVYKEYHGMRLGAALLNYCQEFALTEGYDVLWLGVWQKNEKAMLFYTKCGFKIFGEHVFTLGTDAQIDWLMKKELKQL